MLDWLTESDNAVGVIALFVAIGACVYARQNAKAADRSASAAERSAAAAETSAANSTRITEIEERKVAAARLAASTASLILRRIDRTIHLQNQGHQTATGISIKAGGKNIHEYESVIGTEAITNAAIAPGQGLKFNYTNAFKSDLRFPTQIEIEWDDPSGIRGRWSSTVP